MAIVFTKFSDALLADHQKAVQYAESKMRQLAFHVAPGSVEALSQSFRNTAEGMVYLGKANKLPQPQLASKETCAREEKLLDRHMQEQMKAKKSCLLKGDKDAKGKAGSAGNELVQEERFTYLEKPFKDIAQRIPLHLFAVATKPSTA